MRSTLLLLLAGLTWTALPVQAALPCPVNPLDALGGPWVFNLQERGSALSFRGVPPFLAAGRFTANGNGSLAINATTHTYSGVTRLQSGGGRFTMNADCSGGTLSLNLGGNAGQYDFWFNADNTAMELVRIGDGRASSGTAARAAAGCPVGVPPLAVLPANLVFQLESAGYFTQEVTTGFPPRVFPTLTELYAITGRMRATNGQLAITATSQLTGGSVTRRESDAGSYQVEGDCSGGTLTFNLSSRPVQFQFYFRANYELDMISTSAVGAYGVAVRGAAPGCAVAPASLLEGAWTYNVHMPTLGATGPRGEIGNGPVVSFGAAGQFRGANGTLRVESTSVQNFNVTRTESDYGSYDVTEDCTGGTLTLNLSSFPQQYDLYFGEGQRSAYLMSTRPGVAMVGSAVPAPQGCPAGVAPLETVAGGWIFGIRPVSLPLDISSVFQSPNVFWLLTQAGAMNATAGGGSLGRLAITATSYVSSHVGIVERADGNTRQETGSGTYQVNRDCSGGVLTMHLPSRPMQYQFYFRQGFGAFDAISISGNATDAYGLFRR